MFGTSKIMSEISKLAVSIGKVETNTENHNDELQEFKENFKDHVLKEDKQKVVTDTEIKKIGKCLTEMECPYDGRIVVLEKDNESKEKDKIKEDKSKADADIKTGERIATLESRSKYNLISMGALWTMCGIILKKIFASS